MLAGTDYTAHNAADQLGLVIETAVLLDNATETPFAVTLFKRFRLDLSMDGSN